MATAKERKKTIHVLFTDKNNDFDSKRANKELKKLQQAIETYGISTEIRPEYKTVTFQGPTTQINELKAIYGNDRIVSAKDYKELKAKRKAKRRPKTKEEFEESYKELLKRIPKRFRN